MKISRYWLLFLLGGLFVLAVSLGGCGNREKGSESGGEAQAGPIRIAVAGPMSGSGAAFGEMIKRGATLKAEEVNAAGGIGGRRLELQIEDDKGNTAEATNVARKLAADPRISIVVGHFNSTCSNAAKEEYNRKGVVMFSPGSTNVNVCAGYPWVFRNLYRDDYQGIFLAQYARKILGVEKVGVFYDNDDYGKGLRDAFLSEAKKVGLTVVVDEAYIRERTQDFKPLLSKLKGTGVTAIFVAGLYNEGALIAKTAREDLGMKDLLFLGGDGLMSPDFIKIAGKAAEGAYITTPFLFNTPNETPEAKAFFAKFKEKFGTAPDTWAALTYDAVGMAVEAIKAVGTDRKAIRDWFASRTSKETAYHGITGPTYFDAEGDCYSKGAHVATVRDGRFVPAPKQMTVE